MIKKVSLVIAIAVITGGIASVVAFGRDTTGVAKPAKAGVLPELWVGMVGQFLNSPAGVTPVTHIHYGYLSFVKGVTPVFDVPNHDETSALYTFFADGATSPVIADGPFRTATRVGTLTIYRDPSSNGDWAKPDTFRDGTPILVARYKQLVMQDTVSNVIRTFHEDTITAVKPFDSGRGIVQLGTVGERFEEHYAGHGNMPGLPRVTSSGMPSVAEP